MISETEREGLQAGRLVQNLLPFVPPENASRLAVKNMR